jgi:hypothetical protein
MATVVRNSVKIKNYSDVFEEFTASEAITPGMLVELTSDGKVKKHASESGNVLPMFALEDELQGKGIDDAYAEEAQVQVWVPGRGDIVNALLEDGQNIAIGDYLESAGAGYLQKYVADSTGIYYPAQIVGQAIEAVDLSSSSGTHPVSGLRIKVRII